MALLFCVPIVETVQIFSSVSCAVQVAFSLLHNAILAVSLLVSLVISVNYILVHRWRIGDDKTWRHRNIWLLLDYAITRKVTWPIFWPLRNWYKVAARIATSGYSPCCYRAARWFCGVTVDVCNPSKKQLIHSSSDPRVKPLSAFWWDELRFSVTTYPYWVAICDAKSGYWGVMELKTKGNVD